MVRVLSSTYVILNPKPTVNQSNNPQTLHPKPSRGSLAVLRLELRVYFKTIPSPKP